MKRTSFVSLVSNLILVLVIIISNVSLSIAQQLDEAQFESGPLEFLPGISGDYFKYDSKIVGRPFHIYIRLPENYGDNLEQKYPVVYVLDGDSLFPVIAPNHLFLTYDLGLPESIIVGIAYGSFKPEINKRGFDFSAPAKDAKPNQGGAPEFLEFLKSELIPAVENRYRTQPDRRVLFGQSRGGYMVLYSAFKDPDLFWGRIASNPSFNPGRELFFSRGAVSSKDDLGLVLTSGSLDYPYLRESAVEWFSFWQDDTGAPWSIKTVTIEDGTHASYSATSYRIGMLWLFDKDI